MVRQMLFPLAFFMMIVSLISASPASASWTGPDEVITGSWGPGKGQFGLRSQDGFDVVPVIDAVTADNGAVIYDAVNRKQMIYSSKGSLKEELKWGSGGKGNKPLCIVSQREREAVILNALQSGASSYRITAVFPDRNDVVNADQQFRRATRDVNGFVYGIGSGSIVRFDKSGKQIASISLPAAHEELVTAPGRAPQALYVVYGEPLIGPTGDVFLVKWSGSAFSILKWTWHDQQ
jgi:hypothetical protein